MDILKQEYNAFAEAMERNELEVRAIHICQKAWNRTNLFLQQAMEDMDLTDIARENLQDARENKIAINL